MGGKARAVPQSLSDPWRRWVLDAVAGGSSRQLVVAELVAEGVPLAIAAREVELIAWSHQQTTQRQQRAELVLRLLETESRRRTIERRQLCSSTKFYDRYFATNTPVVFSDGCAPMDVVGRWTPTHLAERGGEQLVRVSSDRRQATDHYIDPEGRYSEMSIGELVRRVLAGGESNDLYLVSRNRAVEGALDWLADEVEAMPDFLDPDIRRGGWSLWFGPAGTETPLHHDTTPILFCQVYGRKRFYLAAPCERELIVGDMHASYFSSAQLSEQADVRIVDVGPGDALFLPIGWWHGVRALDISISASLTGFRDVGDYGWYRPGALGNSRVE